MTPAPLTRTAARLARMPAREVWWRGRAASRIAADRAVTAVAGSRWDRRALTAALADDRTLDDVRTALGRERWQDAHRLLMRHFVTVPQRFAIGPRLRRSMASRLNREYPDAADRAAAHADRLVAGDYDLLGYRGLRFDSTDRFDWHYDPVHDCRAPRAFWSTVPFLDPSCGDHKIIWELNRHQHWIALGRAYWLTGDRRYRSVCLQQLAAWMRANEPLVGINWASMLELSFRSLSWIWALNFFAEADAADSTPWTVDLLLGLDRQLTHVEQNLSHYFSPNTHLLGEGLAMYVAGCALPELHAAARRRAIGRRILVDGIRLQIAEDGGHCERSTHYHRYALDFYVLAAASARIARDPIAGAFERAVGRLATAARALADDEGRLPHIGDDDGGALLDFEEGAPDDVRASLAAAAALTGLPDLRIGKTPEAARWLLAHPLLSAALDLSEAAPPASHRESVSLPATGYYVSRSKGGDHLVIDGGPHGFANGGHAHADALSLTMTRRGVPLLIDPGTGCYTIDNAIRDRFRSTALHNTVVVDRAPQSTPDGPFHWKTTAAADVRCWRSGKGFDYFEATHDGYRPIEHRRHVLAVHDELVLVADLVAGAGEHSASAHWHIDPRWPVTASGLSAALGDGVDLVIAEGELEIFKADAATGLGWHSPVYGRVEPAITIRVTRAGRTPLWIVTAIGLDPANRVARVEVLTEAAGAADTGTITLRMTRRKSVDVVTIGSGAVHANFLERSES